MNDGTINITIWIAVITTIINVATMFVIGYWQVTTAKYIEKNGSDTKQSILDRFKRYAVKQTNKLINLTLILCAIILFYFLTSESNVNIQRVFSVSFITCTLFFTIFCKFFLKVIDLIKEMTGLNLKSFKMLYCMVCKQSLEKPPCIEEIDSNKSK